MGLGWWEWEEKAFLKLMRSGCLGLSIPPLLTDVLCCLILYLLLFFFFLIEIRVWAGEQITLEEAAPRPEGSHGSPSQLPAGTEPLGQAFNKLLVILTEKKRNMIIPLIGYC